MAGYIGRCASCGPKCCESCHRRANNHLDKPAGTHCEGPRWLWQANWILPCPPAHTRQSICSTAGYIGRCASYGPKCCKSCHRRANNPLDKPAGSHCEAPRWLWQTNWVLPDRRAPPCRLAWPMAGYIGRCASCGSKCCTSHHRRAHNHLNKPARSHCAAPRR
jgi:hypothetical protein